MRTIALGGYKRSHFLSLFVTMLLLFVTDEFQRIYADSRVRRPSGFVGLNGIIKA